MILPDFASLVKSFVALKAAFLRRPGLVAALHNDDGWGRDSRAAADERREQALCALEQACLAVGQRLQHRVHELWPSPVGPVC